MSSTAPFFSSGAGLGACVPDNIPCQECLPAAALPPLRQILGVGKGPPHVGVSPSVHEAVRIAPMVVRPAADLTNLSGMMRGEANQSRNGWNLGWIGRDGRGMEPDEGDADGKGMNSFRRDEPAEVERFPRRLGAREAAGVARTGAGRDRDRGMHARAVEGLRGRPSEVVYRRKDEGGRDSGAVGRDRRPAGRVVEPVSVGEADGGLDTELGDEWKEARAPDGKVCVLSNPSAGCDARCVGSCEVAVVNASLFCL